MNTMIRWTEIDSYDSDCGEVVLMESNAGMFLVTLNMEELGRGTYKEMETLYFDTIEDNTHR